MTISTTYHVSGMTCDHCKNAVSSELSALPGVTAVDVDLETGAVIVNSDEPLQLDLVKAAVDEAGYDLSA